MQQESQPSEQQQQGEGQADQPSQQDGGSGEAGDENADPLESMRTKIDAWNARVSETLQTAGGTS